VLLMDFGCVVLFMHSGFVVFIMYCELCSAVYVQ
jgi:hypothetical protein